MISYQAPLQTSLVRVAPIPKSSVRAQSTTDQHQLSASSHNVRPRFGSPDAWLPSPTAAQHSVQQCKSPPLAQSPHARNHSSRSLQSVRAQGSAPPLDLTSTRTRRPSQPQTETGGGVDGGGKGGKAPPSGGGGGGWGGGSGDHPDNELGNNLNPFRR